VAWKSAGAECARADTGEERRRVQIRHALQIQVRPHASTHQQHHWAGWEHYSRYHQHHRHGNAEQSTGKG
jgi:hypothetical protein